MRSSILAFLLLFFAADVAAQVIFRNDFVIRRNHKIGSFRNLRNLGLTTVTINLSKYPNWNQLLNGRGGRTMVIDIRAVRQRKVDYSYQEIANKIYMPPLYTGPIVQTTPYYLLIGLPDTKYPFVTTRGLNLEFNPLTHRSHR